MELGPCAGYVVWDVADVSYAAKAVNTAHQIWGDISVFVNNAGIVSSDDSEPQAEGAYLRDRGIAGNIVNVCSKTGFTPASYPYAISKWGVRGITQGVAVELAKCGIVVNGIVPGETATEILHQPEGEIRPTHSPRGRQAVPKEIANDIFYLSQSRNIIGEILVSDGGRRLL